MTATNFINVTPLHEKYIATGWLELKKDNETDGTENVF